MAADTKIATLTKSAFSPEWFRIFGRNFVWSISRTLMVIDIKMKKKSVAELGHNDRLKIYVDPYKNTSTLAFKSISSKWLGIFG